MAVAMVVCGRPRRSALFLMNSAMSFTTSRISFCASKQCARACRERRRAAGARPRHELLLNGRKRKREGGGWRACSMPSRAEGLLSSCSLERIQLSRGMGKRCGLLPCPCLPPAALAPVGAGGLPIGIPLPGCGLQIKGRALAALGPNPVEESGQSCRRARDRRHRLRKHAPCMPWRREGTLGAAWPSTSA